MAVTERVPAPSDGAVASGARSARPFFLAGGGTVGHLAPAFAIRDALRDLGRDGLFVTPGEAREAAWFPPGDPEPLHVPSPRFPRTPWQALAFPFRMTKAVRAAGRLLRAHRPAAVLALGGWPCAPTAIAARLAGVPVALLATDAVPGSVIRRMHRKALRTYLSREEALAGLPEGGRPLVVGPLVRRAVLGAPREPGLLGLEAGKATLFVVGGSLGARGLNEAVRAGVAAAVAAEPALAARLQILHAAGTEEEATRCVEAYRRAGVAAVVRPFVAEVGTALRCADLVLCRGGASTLAEVDALARPAVVVPYPHHEDRQQWKNAEPLVKRGAAVIVEEAALTPEAFRAEVLGRLFDPASLARMSAARAPGTGSSGIHDAAATIAADLVRSTEDADGTDGSSQAAPR